MRSVHEAVEALGGLDAVVLNAGVLHEAPLSETTDEAWDAVLETNLLGPYRYALACLPELRRGGGGSLTVVSSDAGVWPETAIGAYSVSKRALNMLAQMLAMEAGPAGIRVNAVCPGDTAPGMATMVEGRVETGDTSGWLLPPLGRIGTGEDVAAAVAFFASPDASFVQRHGPAGRRRHAGGGALDAGGESARSGPAVQRAGRAGGVGVSPPPPLYGLHGRVALVTGGTSGIGKACVERLRAEEMTVVFTGRNEERGARCRRGDRRDVPPLRRTRSRRVRPLGRARRFGSAGGSTFSSQTPGSSDGDPIEATPEPAFRELVEVNLTALFRYSRACFAPMRDQGGGSMIHDRLGRGDPRDPRDPGVLGRRRRARSPSPSCSPPRARRTASGRTRSAPATSCRESRRHRTASSAMRRIRRAGCSRRRGASAPGRTSPRSSPGSPPTSPAHMTGATLRIDGGDGRGDACADAGVRAARGPARARHRGRARDRPRDRPALPRGGRAVALSDLPGSEVDGALPPSSAAVAVPFDVTRRERRRGRVSRRRASASAGSTCSSRTPAILRQAPIRGTSSSPMFRRVARREPRRRRSSACGQPARLFRGAGPRRDPRRPPRRPAATATGTSAPTAPRSSASSGSSRVLAKELAPHGVRVNAVAPGLIRHGDAGPSRRGLAPRPGSRARRGRLDTIPLGRAGDAGGGRPDASSTWPPTRPRYVSGATVVVDGGECT